MMIFSESNKEIAVALAKAWAQLENPNHNAKVKVKTKNGGEYSFDYTDFGGIIDEAKRVYKENGLTIIQNAYTHFIDNNKMISVETMILHSSGEFVKSLPLQVVANTSMQDLGGQITYMKRYSLSAMIGIATEKDDDANGSSGNDYSHNYKAATPKQVGRLKTVVKEFALLKGRKDDEVYEALKEQGTPFEDIEKIDSKSASTMISKVEKWIESSKNQGA